MVGFFPVFATWIIASLSSIISHTAGFPIIASQMCKNGRPFTLNDCAQDTISASGVECDVAVCFFDIASIGQHVDSPDKLKCIPVVDRIVSLHPAKSASQYNVTDTPWALSAVYPICRRCSEPLT